MEWVGGGFFATRLSMYMLLRQVGGEGKTMFLFAAPMPTSSRWRRKNGRVTVEDLAGQFRCLAADDPQGPQRSVQPAPSDPASMAGRCFPRAIENVEYEARRKIAADEKSAIGKAAALIIPDGASLFNQHRHDDGGGG